MNENKIGPVVLIVEDGDEYLANLSRFVEGPKYLQSHSGADAIKVLDEQKVDLIYMDMRFDRIPLEDLLGDYEEAMRDRNRDAGKAWKHLQNNQGLFIIDAIKRAGHGEVPVILAYDFTNEQRRFENLTRVYPNLAWVPDNASPTEIRSLMDEVIG